MNYVYKITNVINNKVYIGITSKSLNDRWNNHIKIAFSKSSKDYNTPFKKAIRKYGIENFKIEKLEESDDWEKIKKLEQFYIKKYNSFIGFENCMGYNATLGGDGVLGFNTKKIAKVNPCSGEIIEIYNSLFEAEKDNCRGVLESCKNLITYANNFTWFYLSEIENLSKDDLKDIVFKKCNVLLQLDMDGNILKVWKFLNDAAKTLNIQEGNISLVCTGKRRIAGGFRWAFYNDYIKLENKNIRDIKTTAKTVLKYSLKGKFICSYNSITEASKDNNISDTKICEVCKNKRNQAGGYIWRYKENSLTELEISNLKNLNFNICDKKKSISKKIRNIETNEIFNSISEVSRKYNCSRKTIRKACLDNTYKCAGYHWEFYS